MRLEHLDTVVSSFECLDLPSSSFGPDPPTSNFVPIALVSIAPVPVVAVVSVADCLDPPTSEVIPVVLVADCLDPPSTAVVD